MEAKKTTVIIDGKPVQVTLKNAEDVTSTLAVGSEFITTGYMCETTQNGVKSNKALVGLYKIGSFELKEPRNFLISKSKICPNGQKNDFDSLVDFVLNTKGKLCRVTAIEDYEGEYEDTKYSAKKYIISSEDTDLIFEIK